MSTLWQSLASGSRESFVAKISSLDGAKILDPPLTLPFKSCEATSWQHLHSFSVSIVSHFSHLCHSSTVWLTILLLFPVQINSYDLLWKMALEENLFQAQTEFSDIVYWKMKSLKQLYFINIRLFSRTFFKNRFYSIIRNLLQGAVTETLYF